MREEQIIPIDATSEALDRLLARNRFSIESRNVDWGKFHFNRWVREFDWKLHVVELSWRPPYNDRIDLAFDVCIPYSAAEECKCDGPYQDIFDGVMIDYLVGRVPGYRIPTLFQNVRLKGFVKRIVSDTEKALIWFDQFNTPKQCLQLYYNELRNGSRSDALLARLQSLVVNE
jgi:hypothetical protein